MKLPPIEDHGLRGLPALLNQLPTLSRGERAAKARLIWEALIDLQDRSGQSVFSGIYRFQYHQMRSASFDALFIRQLNGSAWIPASISLKFADTPDIIRT